MSIDGILNLDKPAGISSARAVDKVKRLLPRKTKIGHAGTLDPFATGVLVLLIGKGTKLCERLMDEPKQYEATIKFGATTATDDPDSPEQPRMLGQDAQATMEEIRAVLPQFIGAIQQRPPAFSALKVGGQRAYKLARSGAEVKLEPRAVQVYGIEILDFAWPLLRLRIDCGRGTYIRSIARDLGEALDVGGHLTQLRRTRVGDFAIDRVVTLEQLHEDGVESHLAPLP
ncbi:MAG: tRNA pseudouridine55 synthase [Phycisphaerales bacterium]|jgi:tRNA pseudouridine55 synthase|nr:tRNA pseudouridine55 synthase [Phycisphaerales bacterium]